MPQVAEHQRVSEPVVITTAAPNGCNVPGRQREVPHQFTSIRERIEQCRDLRVGQLLSSRHVGLPAS